jgi:hypothetical protein
MGSNTTVVTQDVTMECLDAIGQAGQVEARLSYDPSEPYAVTVHFTAAGETVPWTFSRELLDLGRYRPAGEADVLVWPSLDGSGRAVTSLELHAPEGSFVAQARTAEITDFLDRSHQVVPAGREAEHLDVDGLISELLG